MRLRFHDHATNLVGFGILIEAGVTFRPVGANEVDVDDLNALDDEQRGSLADLVRDPLDGSPAVPPPVAADGTSAAVELVGDPPPRSGQGATREAWAAYAASLAEAGVDITVRDDQSRDQIIEAVEAATS
jgi:hypothetical protein